jgi:hypothetical protein
MRYLWTWAVTKNEELQSRIDRCVRAISHRMFLLAGTALLAAAPALAGEVTPDRLVNADHERATG